MPRSAQTPDRFSAEVSGEDRRIMGLTPRLLKSFPESPARMLPRNRGLKALAGMTRRKGGGIKVEGL